jgi:prepilin-type N-terminal cleavage/methylation domain-containing protein
MASGPLAERARGRCLRALHKGIRTRAGDEAGFTLIEQLVSLSVVAILLLPVAGIFYTGASGNANNRAYGDAVALADSALAKADAINYSDLFFYAGQFPGVTCPASDIYSGSLTPFAYNGQPGVVKTDPCNPPSNYNSTLQPQSPPYQVGNVQFTLKTRIVSATGSGTCTDDSTSPPTNNVACTGAYVQVYAIVDWTDRGEPASVIQSILVYPGGLGPYTAPQSTGPGPGGSPPNVDVSVPCAQASPPNCSDDDALNLSWSIPSGSGQPGWYEVEMATSDVFASIVNTGGTDPTAWDPQGATVIADVPAPASGFQATGLSASTQYYFVVVAFSPDGSHWGVSQEVASGTTANAPPQLCQLTTLTVSQTGQLQPDEVTVKKNGVLQGHLMQPVTIFATFSGPCTALDMVTVSTTGPETLSYTLTYSPSQYTYNPPSGLCPGTGSPTTFATGTYVFSATLNGVSQNATANVPFTSTAGNQSPQC